MDLFPYAPRKYQTDIVELIRAAASNGDTVVMESGTGTGKTICSLTGMLEYSLNAGKKVVYITRTKSQQKQVISEAARISGIRRLVCIGVQGRSTSTCPFMRTDSELSAGTPEEMSHLCSDLKRRKTDGCPFYTEMDKDEVDRHLRYVTNNNPDPEQFIEYAGSNGRCPYELNKALLPYADIAVVPYAMLLMPNIRQHFLNWLNVTIEDVVVITDEAHNIPDYLREVMTIRFSEYGLRMTDKESSEYNNPEIHNGIAVSDLTDAVRQAMSEAMTEYLGEDDGLVPPFFLEESLMSLLGVSSVSLDRMYRALEDLGEIVVEKKRQMKKLPRSYMRSLGRFLQRWSMVDNDVHVKLITAPPNPSFESYCLDPYDAAEPFRSCHASVHMSGTLEPLDEYAEMLGLNAVCRTFPSPFDPANLLTLYTDDSSTRFEDMAYDPDNLGRLESHVVGTVTSVRRNSAVFFPSYSMMDTFINDGVTERIGKDMYYERRGTEQSELMDSIGKFRKAEDGVLFAVSGGRVSEGIDFPDKDLEMAVLVGIPYPKPNAKLSALVRYCDIRYGRGWDKAIRSPTLRKMRQAIGRIIRSETDRGAAVILDRRAATFAELNAHVCDNIPETISSFFGD